MLTSGANCRQSCTPHKINQICCPKVCLEMTLIENVSTLQIKQPACDASCVVEYLFAKIKR